MKAVSIIFSVYWAVLAITSWCGYPPSNFSVGCGFMVAAIGMASDAFLRD